MEIFINDEKIDFRLENENFLEEVVSELERWASENNVLIQKILYDQNTYNSANEICRQFPVENVTSLKISVKSLFEVHQDNLQLLYQFISLLLKAIEGQNNKLIAELQAEVEPIANLLADFLEESVNSAESVSRTFLDNILRYNPDNPDADTELLANLLQQLKGLKIILNERMAELVDPIVELGKTITALRLSLEEINDISVLIQSGKDRDALNSIIKYSEISQKTLRLYPILKGRGIFDFEQLVIDGVSISDYYIDLNSILSELLEAFSANDSVLIGDLLEYEVAPRLESLTDVLEEIQKEHLK